MPGSTLAVKIGVMVAVGGILVILVIACIYVWRKLRRREDVFSLMRGPTHPASSLDRAKGQEQLPRSEWALTGATMRHAWEYGMGPRPCVMHETGECSPPSSVCFGQFLVGTIAACL